MPFKVKKGYIIAAVVLLILTITNPSEDDFHDFLIAQREDTHAGRIGYFLIFSIYQRTDANYKEDIYIGFFKNFILIKEG